MKPTLLVLAAGMGSRYGGLKQLDPLGPSGETIIDYSVYDAAQAGFGKIVFVIRESFVDEFKNKVTHKYKNIIDVDFAFQEVNTPIEGVSFETKREKPWGTGHAVLVARDKIEGPFAVINADDYYGRAGFEAMAGFLTNQIATDHYAMVGYQLANTLSDHGSVSRGVCQADAQNFLVDVVERTKITREDDGNVYYFEEDNKTTLDENAIVSMNFWGFHPNVFDYIKNQFVEFATEHANNPRAEFFIPLYVNKMLKEGTMKMTVLESGDKWFGITYREDREEVVTSFNTLVTQGVYPSPLW